MTGYLYVGCSHVDVGGEHGDEQKYEPPRRGSAECGEK